MKKAEYQRERVVSNQLSSFTTSSNARGLWKTFVSYGRHQDQDERMADSPWSQERELQPKPPSHCVAGEEKGYLRRKAAVTAS